MTDTIELPGTIGGDASLRRELKRQQAVPVQPTNAPGHDDGDREVHTPLPGRLQPERKPHQLRVGRDSTG